MKSEVHPTYYPEAKVTCVCGNSFEVGSTKEELRVEVCSACHPFYTGGDRNLDRVNQVQKFRERQSKASGKKGKKSA